MGSGPYWVHEGREAEVELDITPKVAGEEEEEEWLLSLSEKKKQRRSGSSRHRRISGRRKGRHNQQVSRIAPRSNDVEPSL